MVLTTSPEVAAKIAAKSEPRLARERAQAEKQAPEFVRNLGVMAEQLDDLRMKALEAQSTGESLHDRAAEEFWASLWVLLKALDDNRGMLLLRRFWRVGEAMNRVSKVFFAASENRLEEWVKELPALRRFSEALRGMVEAVREQHGWNDPRCIERPLESLAELDKLGVSDWQICRMYGWTDVCGRPLKENLILARAGRLDPPTSVPIPAKWPSGWPEDAPQLIINELVDRLGRWVVQQEDERQAAEREKIRRLREVEGQKEMVEAAGL